MILLLETAIADPACFAEEVIRDESTGQPIRLAPHQIEWYSHLDRCAAAGKFAGILAPPSSGKSQLFSVGLPLWTMGREPSSRICVCTFAAGEAKKRVRPAKDYVQSSEEFRRVFPNCKPMRPEKWTELEFSIRRPPAIKDPTYFGTGITRPPMGSRIDLLIGDDVCTYDNTIAEPAMREKVIELWYNGFDTRLSPKSQCVYIGGVIHSRDLTGALMQDRRFAFIKQSIAPDFASLVQEDLTTGERKTLPLWDRAWTPDFLAAKHAANPRAFERAYRHVGYTDDERTFAEAAVRGAVRFIRASEPAPPPSALRFTGVDLASQSRPGNVVFTLGLIGGRRRVLEIRRGAWSSNETARQIVEAWRRWRPLKIMVENNAYQGALIDWIGATVGEPLPIEPFTTGKQKADEVLGIPGLAAEFEQGLWEIPFEEGHAVALGCQCPSCVFVSELLDHPFGQSDTVMAAWFARNAAVRFGGDPSIEFAPGPDRRESLRSESRLARFRSSRAL